MIIRDIRLVWITGAAVFIAIVCGVGWANVAVPMTDSFFNERVAGFIQGGVALIGIGIAIYIPLTLKKHDQEAALEERRRKIYVHGSVLFLNLGIARVDAFERCQLIRNKTEKQVMDEKLYGSLRMPRWGGIDPNGIDLANFDREILDDWVSFQQALENYDFSLSMASKAWIPPNSLEIQLHDIMVKSKKLGDRIYDFINAATAK